jgi:hypothetical protein
MFDEDADYGGALGESILDIMKEFSKQGHSGGSAGITTAILEKLLRWQPLTDLTDDPEEWMDIADMMGGETMYQSRRNPSCFSTDLKQYYNIDDNDKEKLYDLQRQ